MKLTGTQIRYLLEPLIAPDETIELSDAIQLSIAISLKRLADTRGHPAKAPPTKEQLKEMQR